MFGTQNGKGKQPYWQRNVLTVILTFFEVFCRSLNLHTKQESKCWSSNTHRVAVLGIQTSLPTQRSSGWTFQYRIKYRKEKWNLQCFSKSICFTLSRANHENWSLWL